MSKAISTDPSLADFFHAIVPLSAEERSFVIEKTIPLRIHKGGMLFRPGTPDRFLYFIKKGVVRSYIVESGRQVTTWINEENEVVAPGRTFGLKLPSIEYLQALEPSDLCRINYADIEYMYEHFPVANKIGRILLEDNYRCAEERAFLARIMSASRRYQRFVELQSSLLKRVPLKYIASYLNMSLETLSRVRGKKELK